MQLVSLNVSTCQTIEYNGKQVATGIFKTPAAQPLQVSFQGIEGDEQADLVNHGGSHKAVYGFCTSHYSHWNNVIQRNISWGAFGENLSVDSLSEGSIFIGDQFSVGSCVLEVSQPRVPCFKLGVALGDKTLPKQFTAHGRTGVYFRVLREGTIQVGDALTKIHGVENSVSIESLFRAKFDKSFDEKAFVFSKARQLVALAPEWQEKVR
ncbi:MOSC domain-containing protein [Halioxenophilus aromaticivorans]|uniref:MOSC domain-containing protein n=1 Tax=Halioxenophilus aromaticivorans TaxID=1306992 RepID=A0AAV3TXG5_9ALTE